MQIVVIGAGIVGLHVARALNEKGHQVFVLEKDRYLAEQTSGRNSGVIHAGIFYAPGALKEALCIEGNRKTYEWARRLGVEHRGCGKMVVPEPGQEADLEPFFERVRALPIPAPYRVSKDEMRRRIPELHPMEAICVPSTGILDAAGYVKALARYLEERGVEIILNCRVTGAVDGKLTTERGEIEFDRAVNSAGLFADEIAGFAGLPGYEVRPCRGDYYVLNRQPSPCPVYHLPYKGAQGLGIHLTPTLDGQTLLGPNAFFIDGKEDYGHRSAAPDYERAVAFYLPGFKGAAINVAYSGNRPKLYKDGKPVTDFTIERRGAWIHLLGIESPGLTAAPAIADRIAGMV